MCYEGGWRCAHGQGPSEDSLLLDRTLLAALKHGVVWRASKEESQSTFGSNLRSIVSQILYVALCTSR